MLGEGGSRSVRMPPRRHRLFHAAVVCAILCFSCCRCSAELPRLEHPAKPDGSLSVLVVGDWGRKGLYNQTRVAEQMGRVGSEKRIDFVISTGDNFYENGLTGVDDPQFEQSFSGVYTAEILRRTQWYAVLGNHDYRGDALAQLSPVLRQLYARWLCMRSFVLDAEVADFFFVDTTPFHLYYWTEPEAEVNHYDWRGVEPRDKYINNLLKDLDAALKHSTAKWKLVVGHHTIRSVGEHGDTPELLDLLVPVLQANGVDLYINGHDHCLEHVSSRDSPIQYLTSGGGSKAWNGKYTPNADELKFFYDGQGFMTLEIGGGGEHLEFAFYDIFGKVLHKSSLTKELHPFA